MARIAKLERAMFVAFLIAEEGPAINNHSRTAHYMAVLC